MTRLLDVWFGQRKLVPSVRTRPALSAIPTILITSLDLSRAPSPFPCPCRKPPYADRIVRPFFSGLLPDEGARRRLARALGISDGNAFGLLAVIGGECAGAVSLYPPGQEPPSSDGDGVELLSSARLEEILGKLRERPLLGGEEGVRLSLAGAQDKLAVCVDEDNIGLAKGGRATTHILKPCIQGLDGTVENELFCLRLAARLKLSVRSGEMRHGGAIPFLLVERYDRSRQSDGTITRRHQEDFCQALSVPPELKDEAEGGPGAARSLDLIGRATTRPAADRLAFLRRRTFHYLAGNADAHGKNDAVLYRAKVPDLAPLYDVAGTAADPRLAKKRAMAIGGRARPGTIQLTHWLTLVPDTRGAQRLLVKDVTELAGRIRGEAGKLLAEFADAGTSQQILQTMRGLIDTRAAHLLRITHA